MSQLTKLIGGTELKNLVLIAAGKTFGKEEVADLSRQEISVKAGGV